MRSNNDVLHSLTYPEDHVTCLVQFLTDGRCVHQVVNESATGSTTSKRVRLNLTIAVERVDFDSVSCLLRLSGRNSAENPHVKVPNRTTLSSVARTVDNATCRI